MRMVGKLSTVYPLTHKLQLRSTHRAVLMNLWFIQPRDFLQLCQIVILKQGQPCPTSHPQGTSGNIWKYIFFYSHNWESGVAGIYWVKAMDVVKYPTMHRKGPHRRE